MMWTMRRITNCKFSSLLKLAFSRYFSSSANILFHSFPCLAPRNCHVKLCLMKTCSSTPNHYWECEGVLLEPLTIIVLTLGQWQMFTQKHRHLWNSSRFIHLINIVHATTNDFFCNYLRYHNYKFLINNIIASSFIPCSFHTPLNTSSSFLEHLPFSLIGNY